MDKDLYKDQGDRYSRLTNFYTAAFLFSKNQTLVNIERTPGQKRAQFVFLSSPELELLLQSFNYAKEDSPETMVDARKLISSVKTLKDKLYQEDPNQW